MHLFLLIDKRWLIESRFLVSYFLRLDIPSHILVYIHKTNYRIKTKDILPKYFELNKIKQYDGFTVLTQQPQIYM